MMTIIVPTDFSATANNAARYAAQMLTGQYDVLLVIYHVYDDASEEKDAENSLTKLRDELLSVGTVKIETRCEESGDFIGALDRLARHLDANLIVMGITGKTKLEQVFFGSNTLKMVERNVCPVLIVPPAAQYTQVKNVALTSDFKDVETSIPFVPIKNVLRIFRPSLHIVNVNSDHYVSLTEEYLAQRSNMLDMFREFNPEFYFIGTFDVEDTINTFVQDKSIDMLITIPKHRSMITGLVKGSTTKRLVFESAIPILAAHE
jgi:nucleotide-binding universal stress UspA family protein